MEAKATESDIEALKCIVCQSIAEKPIKLE